MSLRTCTARGCREPLDWEGPPSLCVEHFDLRAASLSADELPSEPRRNRALAHAADRAGAEAVRAAFPVLTERQALSLMAYARTGSQAVAAYETGVSVQTMKNHMSEVYSKLEVGGIVQALYRVFGVEAQVARREHHLREVLTEYVTTEWLEDALKESAHAAVEAMIRTIDVRLYTEQVIHRDGPSVPLPTARASH